MSVILINEQMEIYSSYEEMFQKISEKGLIIDSVSNGVLVIGGKELQFLVTAEAQAAEFKADVESYRDRLRANIVALKNQGIAISKPELDKLAKQFDFVKAAPVVAAADTPEEK